MNPLHRHKVTLVGYQVKRTLKSRQLKKLRKSVPQIDPARGWRLSKKVKKEKVFLIPSPKKNPARAEWPKRLGLVRVTPWADFAVIGAELCSTIVAIFSCVALSWKFGSLFQIIVDYCQPQKRTTIWIWVQLLENFVNLNPNNESWYQRIIQSWFAAVPSILLPA